jgi:hypothetical protein
VFRTACGFLGLNPEPIPQSVGVVVNKGFEVRSQRLRRWTKARWVPKRVQNLVARLNQPPLEYPEMDAGVRRQLNEAFRADIEAAAIAVQRTRAPAVNPSTPGSTSTV